MAYFIFDIETTGLFRFGKDNPADGPEQPRIASVAGILLDELGEELDRFDMKVKPTDWNDYVLDNCLGAFRVNGHTLEDLWENGYPIDQVLDEWLSMYERCNLLISYGITFDTKGIRAELRRAGRPEIYREKKVMCLQRPCSDICQIPPTPAMLRANKRWNKTPNLAEACKIMLGYELKDAHQAIADTAAAADLFRYFLKRNLVNPQIQGEKYKPL